MSFHIPYTPALRGPFLVSLDVNSFQNAVFSDFPLSHASPKSLRKRRPWLEEAGVTMGANSFHLLCSSCSQILNAPMLAELTLDKFRTGVNKQISPHLSPKHSHMFDLISGAAVTLCSGQLQLHPSTRWEHHPDLMLALLPGAILFIPMQERLGALHNII